MHTIQAILERLKEHNVKEVSKDVTIRLADSYLKSM